LFLSKDGLEVVRVDCSIASIPPFGIDVPSSSESIRFCAETIRAEHDDKIELGKVSDHRTCLWVNTLVVAKYSRFL